METNLLILTLITLPVLVSAQATTCVLKNHHDKGLIKLATDKTL